MREYPDDQYLDQVGPLFSLQYGLGGGSSCYFYYSVTEESLYIGIDVCLLEFINTTNDMSSLANDIGNLLKIGSYERVPYSIEGNTLTIGSQESGYAVFVAED